MRIARPNPCFGFSAPLRLSLATILVCSLLGCGNPSPPGGGTTTGTGGGTTTGGDPPVAPAVLTVLSTRPEYVTGNDVLVDVTPELDASEINASVASNILTVNRVAGVAGKTRLLISALMLGENTVHLSGISAGTPVSGDLQVINHMKSGPLFSGPHQDPYICQTDAAGLGPATDTNCAVASMIRYYYMSSNSGAFYPVALMDPDAPYPSDLRMTTTVDGKTVPFIMRVESGVINRGVFHIAVLDDPHSRPEGAAYQPSEGWNQRLLYSFGGGCSTGHHQGGGPNGFARVEEATLPWILADGYAHIVNSLNEGGVSCNDVTSAETLMMTREHFIESYGLPQWTMGRGGSGGGIQQLMITQNYPGLLDGIVLRITFPDNTTVAPDVVDCKLMNRVFGTNPALWNESAKQAATGFATSDTCNTWESVFSPGLDPARGCDASIPPDSVYNAATRPNGVRCTIQDNYRNIYGVNALGMVPLPYDNEGVQYGLGALMDGTLTTAQFIDLNQNIGGTTIDLVHQVDRNRAETSILRTAYRSGRITNGNQTGLLPIIDINYYVDAVPMFDVHDRVRPFMVRERIRRTFGDDNNHVIWTSNQSELVFNPTTRPIVDGKGIDVMRDWLDALAANPPKNRAEMIAAKPAAAKDGCYTTSGDQLVEDPAEYGGTGPCDSATPAHATPRLVAGAPLAGDILKCQLKPFSLTDYGSAGLFFTPAQITQLQSIFATGVCNYGAPGVEQSPPAGTWLRYDTPFAEH